MPSRDIIVMGGSAGGIEALREVVSSLPEDLPAAVLVVIHQSATGPGFLPRLLAKWTRLAVPETFDGDSVRSGRIYVAPPDCHLLLDAERRIRLSAGPKENGVRPAVDPLFRSAALVAGCGVIGVILSGMLDDGSGGALAIQRRGGALVIQSPEEALFPCMPQHALEATQASYVLPAREIAPTLVRLSQEWVETVAAPSQRVTSGPPTIFTCPDCGGTLKESEQGRLISYDCYEGHSYNPDSLSSAKSAQLEAALWTALRTLDESAKLYRRLMARALHEARGAVIPRLEARAAEAERKAELIRGVLGTGQPRPPRASAHEQVSNPLPSSSGTSSEPEKNA